MLLTLENIQNQQFNQRFRGYDMAEVDAFLDKIAESYLFLSTENGKVKEELAAIKNERNQSLEEEQSFKNAIISAQSFADDIKQKAEGHAQRLKEDAKDKSTLILEEAQQKVNSLNDQISILAGEKGRIKDELRQLLSGYLQQIDDDTITGSRVAPVAEVVNMDQVPGLMGGADPLVMPEEEIGAQTTPEPDNSDAENNKDDVAILYEKLDLDDDGMLTEIPEMAGSEAPAPMAMDMSTATPEFSTDELNELDGLEVDIPDLDGDMLYSLDDPLDQDSPEPAVVIEPLADDKN